jgi:hypothetical protein
MIGTRIEKWWLGPETSILIQTSVWVTSPSPSPGDCDCEYYAMLSIAWVGVAHILMLYIYEYR